MSKSREAFDRENPSTTQQENEPGSQLPTRNEERTALGGQTNYGIGRESRGDFPRRSTSNRGRSEPRSQSSVNPQYRRQNEPYSSAQYDQQMYPPPGRQSRGGANADRSAYDRTSQYQNRQWTEEDSGDFYSRGIRERTGDEDYANRDQPRGYRSREQGQYPSASRSGARGQDRDLSNRTPSQIYGSQSYRGDQGYDRSNQNYDNQFADNRGYRRQEIEAGNPPRREYYETETPRYGQNQESHFGTEPWFDRPSEGAYYTVRCRDLMTRDVTTCTPETPLREVAEIMEAENIGSIPVVENGRLIGLVTDRDIVCRILAEGRDTRTTTAREAMTDDLITCLPEEPVVDAIHKMGECQVRRIPVCDPTGKIRGILSMGDVALEAERDVDVANALEQISQPNRYASRRRW